MGEQCGYLWAREACGVLGRVSCVRVASGELCVLGFASLDGFGERELKFLILRLLLSELFLQLQDLRRVRVLENLPLSLILLRGLRE